MFLIGPDRNGVQRALGKLQDALGELARGPIAMIPVGESWLGWFRARQSDALHVFSDALVVGKLAPGEPGSVRPIEHSGRAPAAVHSLVLACSIESPERGVRITPHNTTNIFYDRNSVSDMQLLIADAKGYRPAPEGVAILGTMGYFPGELTLFSEIARIPLFHALDLQPGRLVRVGHFEIEPPDDRAMVDRLVSIIPQGRPSAVALSGGCDSRFVLGILRKANQRPSIVRLSDGEDAIPERIAAELGLPLTVVREPAPDPDPELYTVMTDAQIYVRGGHYGRLRREVPADTLYYAGLFANPILKNAYRAAWKVPRFRRDMLTRLVEHSFLGQMRPREAGLRAFGEKARLLRFLRERVTSPLRHPTSKEQAGWFSYAHLGLRWIPAHLDDLSCFVEPVFPLSDLKALALGLGSSAWANFGHERVRRLNAQLLPEVSVGYASGLPKTAARGPRSALDKLVYEYGTRALVYARDRVANRPAPVPVVPPAVSALGESPGFRDYFDLSFPDAAAGRGCSRSVGRAAVTVNCTLRYLDEQLETREVQDQTRSLWSAGGHSAATPLTRQERPS